MSSPDDLRLLRSIPGLTTPRVADTLDSIGLRHQVCAPVLHPVRYGDCAVGRAVTVAFEVDDGPDDPADPYAAMIGFIDSLIEGDFPVIAGGGDHRTAYWGQLFSAAAAGHGAAGVVCDGPVRDTTDIAALGFPVFARTSRPVDYRGRMRVRSTGVPVDCAGVTVSPGDAVVADDDGVVIVPSAVIGEVAGVVLRRARSEDRVLEELLGGASLREVWNRHRVL